MKAPELIGTIALMFLPVIAISAVVLLSKRMIATKNEYWINLRTKFMNARYRRATRSAARILGKSKIVINIIIWTIVAIIFIVAFTNN